MFIQDWYKNALEILKNKRIYNLNICLIHILSHILKRSGEHIRLLLTQSNETKTLSLVGQLHESTYKLSSEELATLNRTLYQLNKGVPVSKILHSSYFCGYEFYVNEHVLCPRQVTQELVAQSLNYIKINTVNNSGNEINILDLGTGSGCIAITIYKLLKPNLYNANINIYAIDKSIKALNVAKYNAKRLNTEINFIQSNWFNKLNMHYKHIKFDVIASNPPYLAHREYIHKTAKYDPHIALFAKSNGFSDYKKILLSSKNFLKPNGVLILEIPTKFVKNLEKYKKQYNFITSIKCTSNISIATLSNK